jgi:ribonuclease-3
MTEPAEPRPPNEGVDKLRETLTVVIGAGDIPRLEEALTHPSYGNETGTPDNQRLEFLGDAVLGLCVSEILQASFPDADEGALTRMRASLVNADALAQWARRVSLGDALYLGRGARAGGERAQTNVLSDAVEAVVAAVFEARGLDGARALVRDIVSEPLREVSRLGERDAKSLLQERVQKGGLAAPIYRVKESRGPAHDPTFVAEVVVEGEVRGTGEGKSKRAAERAAAEAALAALAAEAVAPPEPTT